MFPSINRENHFEPLYKRPSSLCDDHNPNLISKLQDDPSPFFFNFPSPFFDEHDLPLNQILMSQNAGNHYLVDQIENNNNDSTRKEKNTKKSADQPMISSGPLKRRNLGTIPRRRTGKKDRHSKICTAQGIRDRRMRLSLQVARKFFDLQDMLGYDKASETIEWLFSQSKKAIKELSTNKELPISDGKSESFLSECEVVSGIEENSNEKNERKLKKNERKKSQQTGCKPNTRESRDKARARARFRTREKMMIKNLENSSQRCKSSSNCVKKLGLSTNSPFEGVDQESSSQNQEIRVSQYGATNDYASIEDQLDDVGIIEKYLGSASSDCLDPNSNFMEFLGNWDLLNNDRLNSSQFAVTNQVSLAGNDSNSIYLGNSNFPLFHH